MRFSAALVAVALALAGCAAAKQPPAAPPPPHVYTLSGDQVAVYDLQGHLERLLPAGIPAPDWSLLYVTTPAGVQAVDTRTGVVVRSLALEGAYAMPRPNLAGLPQGLSPDGRWLALGGKGRLVIVDTAFKNRPTYVRLAGDFEFDALSNDGRRLYLAQALTHGYQVRRYDVGNGLAVDPIVDKTDLDATMSGFRVTSLDPPGGDFHYGLYVRPDRQPFVHALPLEADRPYAFCVFLPWPGYTAPAPDWSLARGAGGRIYASSGLLRRVAEIDTSDYPKLARTLEIPRLTSLRNPFLVQAEAKAEAVAPGAVISSDLRHLYFPDIDGIDAVDLVAFKLTGRWLRGEFVQSLVAAPDGSLFALAGGSVFRVDPSGGRQIARFEVPAGVERLLLVAA